MLKSGISVGNCFSDFSSSSGIVVVVVLMVLTVVLVVQQHSYPVLVIERSRY